MNKLTIIGNLVRDPEVRTVQSGSTVCSFTVAVNRRRAAEGQPQADYFRVSAWNKLGDVCQKYLAKGRKVCVVGQVSVSSYEGRDGDTRFSLDVHAEDIEFLTPKGANTGGGAAPSDADEDAQYDNGAFAQQDQTGDAADDDDLPF